MCGIAGILSFGGRPVDAAAMKQMVESLAHRGRDHSAIEWGSPDAASADRKLSQTAALALGHRRLSIIDLSEAASQPMPSTDGRCWVVFNGEIYNYMELREELRVAGVAFRTQSDTEVLLEAYRYWGDDFIARLNGMFAFALWDDKRQRLVCARDHLGIKPFFVYHAAGFVAFASESKALRAFHRNQLRRDGLAAYLLSLYLPADWSIFEGVAKLPPAHLLIVEPSGATTLRRYWRLEHVGDQRDDVERRANLERALDRAVCRQLRSDVPVGALLSGGVDSGMVVALATRHRRDLHTYSIGFEGQPVNELPAATEIAQAHGTQHHIAFVSEAESLAYLDRCIDSLTEPIADPSIVPSYILSQMAAADGIKVLLSGTGGDEIFGGYQRYAGGMSLQRRLLSRMPELVRRSVGHLLPPSSKLGARLRNSDFDMLISTGGSFALCAALVPDPTERAAFLARLASAFPKVSASTGLPLLYRQMTFDLAVYLPEEILYLFDQMSMAHTVEGRVPLLDIDVVESAFRFPAGSHVRGNRTKLLFRELAEQHLGHAHVWREKHGFTGPVQAWVAHHRKQFVDSAASLREISGLESVGEAAATGANLSSDELFILYCLRRWHDGIAAS